MEATVTTPQCSEAPCTLTASTVFNAVTIPQTVTGLLLFTEPLFSLFRSCCVSPGTPASWITSSTTVPPLPGPTSRVRGHMHTHQHTHIHHHVNTGAPFNTRWLFDPCLPPPPLSSPLPKVTHDCNTQGQSCQVIPLCCMCLLKCVCFFLSTGKVGDEECAIIYPPNGELLSVARANVLF